MLMPLLLREPDGILACCLTLVPFTAPTAVLLRLPFGISITDVTVAVLLMLLCFALAALLAARTYKRHLI